MDQRGNDTYWTGKGLGRAARIAEIADQVGDTTTRDSALNAIRSTLTDWFTASHRQDRAGLLLRQELGHPDRLPGVVRVRPGAQRPPLPLRLLHRRRRDPGEVRPDLGGDQPVRRHGRPADPGRQQLRPRPTPASRTCGTSTSTPATTGRPGTARSAAGNNQESSSEGMNFANALIQWGQATGNTAVRDAGIFLYTTQAAAIQEYWFDVSDQNFPAAFGHSDGRHGLGRRRRVRHLVQRRAGDDPGHQPAADHRRSPVPGLQPGVRADATTPSSSATTADRRRSGRTSSGSSRPSATPTRRWRTSARTRATPRRRARAGRTPSTGSATWPPWAMSTRR